MAWVLVGTARAPTKPAQVVIYTQPPATFEEIAILRRSNHTVLPGGQYDKMLKRLQAQAAQLGANGLILEEFDEQPTTSIGSGIGTESYSAHGNVALGLGGALNVYKITGNARAIYVPSR